MKLTDYVIDFFYQQGVRHAFVLQGGAVAHLIDSGEKHSDFTVIAMQHEQAAAMAADAYSRTSSAELGLAMATSGPGATNLITGIACSYYDSIATVFITGNVASFRQSDRLGVRQYGFQETDIIKICTPITKYAVQLSSPGSIAYELEKAVHIATQGRPGPVLIDIPDDFQRVILNTKALKQFVPERTVRTDLSVISRTINKILPVIEKAQRPVFVFGAGLRLGDLTERAMSLAKKLQVPFLYTWALKGMCSWYEPLCAGTFGTNSPRYGNFAVQNADVIIAIGSRLDTHATGKLDYFARDAIVAAVDIDKAELQKFSLLGRALDYPIHCSAEVFIEQLEKIITSKNCLAQCDDWLKKIACWKQQFQPQLEQATANIDPYQFFKRFSHYTYQHRLFTLDTGAGLAYFMANYYESKGQYAITAFNNTPMGYALPAAIGAAFATDKQETIICISGDGGLQINIQELATVAYHQLPIKIIVVNNAGHTMIKQTQDDWLASNYYASSTEYGLPDLAFKPIAEAYGINAIELYSQDDVDNKITQLLADNKPTLMDMYIDHNIRINPMIKWGRPLEDSSPLLPRNILEDNMMVPVIKLPREDKS